MDEQQNVTRDITLLCGQQKLGVLASSGERYPYNTLVGFGITPDLRRIVFATLRDTRKYRNIAREEHVSLLVDNRTNQAGDFKDAMALTVLGSCGECGDASRRELLPLFLGRHPQLQEFVDDPQCALMEITVHRYVLVRRFQEVFELKIS